MPKNIAISRKQLDLRFQEIKKPGLLARPQYGWIRAIRDSLGMSAAQLARRLGVSQPRVTALEQGEVKGKLTLQTLEKTADALNCTLVYALVPNQSLEKMVQDRAKKMAAARLKTVGHTMDLEDQGVLPGDVKAHHKQLVEDIIRREIRHIWDQS